MIQEERAKEELETELIAVQNEFHNTVLAKIRSTNELGTLVQVRQLRDLTRLGTAEQLIANYKASIAEVVALP